MLVCPCCGHRALVVGERAVPLCEVCAWEVLPRWARYPRDLVVAQREYVRIAASDESLLAFTRVPRAEEARPAWWLSQAEGPRVLRAMIEEAFADVTLDGGVSLAEAKLIYERDAPRRQENERPPKGFDDAPPWQALLTDAGYRHGGHFTGQDARGLRYHFPAFACAHLCDLERAPIGTVFALHESPVPMLFALHESAYNDDRLDALVRLTDDRQHHAIARYLAFIAAEPHDDFSARRIMAHDRWIRFLDPEHASWLRFMLAIDC